MAEDAAQASTRSRSRMPSKTVSRARAGRRSGVRRAACRKRLHSIGVRLSETKPEIRMATLMVTANSWNRRPMMPLMNSTGMKTAASESVMERMVKPISRAPSMAACMRGLPISMWRTMFSRITMASSTTKPTESVSAISERLSSV